MAPGARVPIARTPLRHAGAAILPRLRRSSEKSMQHRHTIVLLAALATIIGLSGCESKPSDGRDNSPPRKAAAGLPIRMKPREVREFVRQHPEALLLDVRNPSEWSDDVGHMEGSRQIPLSLLGGRLTEIEGWKNRPVITISRIGDRGAAAALVLREAGFTQ